MTDTSQSSNSIERSLEWFILLGGTGALIYLYSRMKTSGTTPVQPVEPTPRMHTVTHTVSKTVRQTVTKTVTRTPRYTPQRTPRSTPRNPQGVPATLPNFVTRRCGTVYVSFGASTAKPGYIVVGQYVNGRLVTAYWQPRTQSPSFDPAGSWVGGYECQTGTTHSSTTPAIYGWADLGNGCYQAQKGATLSGLAQAVGMSYQTLASLNGLSNPNYIQVGWVICTHQTAASGGSSGPMLTIDGAEVSS